MVLGTAPPTASGFSVETATIIAPILQRVTHAAAIAITDRTHILGWSGPSCPLHRPGSRLAACGLPDPKERRFRIVELPPQSPPDLCALPVAAVAPILAGGQVMGSLQWLDTSRQVLPEGVGRLLAALAQLLSILLTTAEANRERSLVSEARLEALQAQIRPHFLFNVLNTIIVFSRTDPERSRELLVQLATFFRRSLSHRGPTIPLKEEIDYVQTYLNLQKARFGDKLRYRIRLDPGVLHVPVPVLVLQPLVENAVVHGLAPKEGPGMVSLTARQQGDYVHIFITDNGVGIPPDHQAAVFTMGEGTGMGLGLSNVAERLHRLYGPIHPLLLRSFPGRGTTIRVRLPAPENPTPPSPAVEGGSPHA